jgi:tripartite-type tricarboxylate transporter receptor subunit TctC
MMPARHADYPCRPLLIVEPFGKGGGPDLLARALAGPLAQRWRQPVDVRNVTGEGATAAPRYVASAPADGYSLLINTSAQAYSAVIGRELSYDPLHDFVAVLPLTSQPYVVVTSVSTGIQSLDQLITRARATANEATYGSTGIGTGTHIGCAMLNRICAISARHVPPNPTDSNANAVANAIAGRFTYCMLPIGLALPAIRADQLVALGVTTVGRSSLLPHVNTIAEAGIGGFDFPIWYGLWVRAGTPADVIEKIAHDTASVLRSAELRSWIAEHGGEPMNMPRDEFARFVLAQSTLAKDILTAQ